MIFAFFAKLGTRCHNSKVSKSAVGESDYNENDQAVVEEDWNPCNFQSGPQNCPLQGKCQVEGENVVADAVAAVKQDTVHAGVEKRLTLPQLLDINDNVEEGEEDEGKTGGDKDK